MEEQVARKDLTHERNLKYFSKFWKYNFQNDNTAFWKVYC